MWIANGGVLKGLGPLASQSFWQLVRPQRSYRTVTHHSGIRGEEEDPLTISCTPYHPHMILGAERRVRIDYVKAYEDLLKQEPHRVEIAHGDWTQFWCLRFRSR